ncbi:hypothetical protein HNP88_000349 [Methanococcus maripaludis]|uniref:Uncharacterized protein n=1 Tax=Methanococcus maripaludis TaxID=39152 RepID=A0A7J9NL59_METMI|nr:hypothetical protein [Methanococcus maripaludis]MBA2846165.1 hypothetical protein [Methanococcus maripaludis]
MSIKCKGLDKLIKNVKKLEGTHNIPFNELFNRNFMLKYTNCSDVEEFFEKGGFKADTEEEFEKIDEELLDKHVSENTKFGTWVEMLNGAGHQWAEKEFKKAFKF